MHVHTCSDTEQCTHTRTLTQKKVHTHAGVQCLRETHACIHVHTYTHCTISTNMSYVNEIHASIPLSVQGMCSRSNPLGSMRYLLHCLLTDSAKIKYSRLSVSGTASGSRNHTGYRDIPVIELHRLSAFEYSAGGQWLGDNMNSKVEYAPFK